MRQREKARVVGPVGAARGELETGGLLSSTW